MTAQQRSPVRGTRLVSGRTGWGSLLSVSARFHNAHQYRLLMIMTFHYDGCSMGSHHSTPIHMMSTIKCDGLNPYQRTSLSIEYEIAVCHVIEHRNSCSLYLQQFVSFVSGKIVA